VTQQVPPQPNAAHQGAIARVMDPEFAKVNPVPVGAGEAEFIANQVRKVTPERFLDPSAAKAVEQQAGRFGQYVEVKAPQQPFLDELNSISSQIRALPGKNENPAALPLLARVKEINAILGGTAPWPSKKIFQPSVENVGQVESIRQQMGGGQGTPFLGAPAAAEGAMKKSVECSVDAALPVAGYGPALKKYGEIADAVKAVESTAGRTAGKVVDPLQASARVEAGPELLYAAATNPGWALMRPAYRAAENANARILDKLMQATSIEELARLAAKNPRNEALISALRGLIAPAQQGAVDYETLSR